MEDRGGMEMKHIVVAVDGPAGSGKSSVSRTAARQLGFDYQDTGAAYRALAWLVQREGIDPEDSAAVIGALDLFEYAIGINPEHYFVRVGESDVTGAIRDPQVSAIVSSVARVPEVREHVTAIFRDTIANDTRPGIITEGRDITTVVAPDADVRVLLTASEEARMARRAAELDGPTLESVGAQLSARDAQDRKVVDFMTAADGVHTLDSTDLTFDETVDALIALIRAAQS